MYKPGLEIHIAASIYSIQIVVQFYGMDSVGTKLRKVMLSSIIGGFIGSLLSMIIYRILEHICNSSLWCSSGLFGQIGVVILLLPIFSVLTGLVAFVRIKDSYLGKTVYSLIVTVISLVISIIFFFILSIGLVYLGEHTPLDL